MPEDNSFRPSLSAATDALPRKLRSVRDVEEVAARRHPAAMPLLIRALGHRQETVRLAAAGALRDFGEPTFIALITTLAGGTKRQRETAAACLGDWQDTRAVQPLLDAIKRGEEEKRKLGVWGCIALLYFWPLGVILWPLAKWGVISVRDTTRLRIAAAESLGRIGDVRATGVLAAMTRSREKSGRVGQAACDALVQLLPRVKGMVPEEVDQLGEGALAGLCALLMHENHGLAHHALEAICSVGDGRAISFVERLRDSRRAPGYLRGEASAALLVLQERAANEQARTTLLRGASSSTMALSTAPRELLRPAQAGTPATPAEQLLRASAAESQETE